MSRFHHDFEVLGKLGNGGYGYVYRALHKLDGQQYAVKIVPLSGRNSCSRQMAVREAKIMATLNHPHIVRYHTAWVDTCLDDYCIDEEVWDDSHEDENEDDYEEAEDKGKVICIQMELYPSGLDIVLKPAEYVYEEDRALSYFRRIMQALDHLHELGVVHRDLQPANILLDRDDRIKIADFGLAKYLNNLEGEANHSLCQTIRPYDAPEMSNRDNLTNEKVDIFSMGIIWFELCHPFSTEAERCHNITKLKGGELDTNWLDNFVKKSWLVRRMIAKEPSERPSARDVLEMLDGA